MIEREGYGKINAPDEGASLAKPFRPDDAPTPPVDTRVQGSCAARGFDDGEAGG